jgi:colanic acid/amylovoran biosynthesis glycosyltransferase
MGVLIFMPNWAAPSELWMTRMIEAIEPFVVAVAAPHPAEDSWQGRIPAVAVRDQPAASWRRICHKCRFPVNVSPRQTEQMVLRGAVEDPKVTVILVHYLEFALRYWPVWASTSKKMFVHCHGYDVTWDLRQHERPNILSHTHNYIDQVRHLAKRATLIANSQLTAQKLEKIGIDRNAVVVKPYGIPAPCFPNDRRNTSSCVNILYLGRLVDFKGPDLVIRAFERACDKGLCASLTIAGDGPLKTTCELMRKRSRYSQLIRLTGKVSDDQGKALRAAADIFTAHNRLGPLSHQEEAFGVSIVEAMAAALPVVTGRSGGVEETVVHGETGILVTPGDVEAHAEAFMRLARDPDLRRQMGEAGWLRAKNEFSQEQERDRLRQIMGLEGQKKRLHH